MNGPSVVCPNTINVYSVGTPQGILCNSWDSVNWRILGDAQFIDVNGNLLGKEIICCNFFCQCQTESNILVKTFSYGDIAVQVQGNCSGFVALSPTNQIGVIVGLKPPASLTGPTEACVGSNLSFSATAVINAYSYTWTVPNSTWQVNGQLGPIVTVPSTPVLNPNIAQITIGTPGGANSVAVRVNTAGCAGNGFTFTSVNAYSSVPGSPGKIFYSTNCINEGISITCPAIANASLYFLQVTDGGAPVLTALSPTPDFNFIPTYVASYTVSLIASNVCGSGPAKLSTLNTIDCGGGGTIQRMVINMSPNPANHQVSVDLSPSTDQRVTNKISQKDFADTEMEVVVYSSKDGSMLFNRKTKEKSFIIDTKNMPSDHYVLKASLCGENIVRQLIMNHQ